MINKEYILIPILCAIIGYSTNWLAIKMIFRPFEPKYLFGIKIPFTPGLIAKERGRIAQNIGRTLEEEILTKEELSKFFSEMNIEKSIDDFIVKTKNDNIDNNEEVYKVIDKNLNLNSKQLLNDVIQNKIQQYLQNEKFKTNSKNILEYILQYASDEKVITSLNNVIVQIFDNSYDDFIKFINSDKFDKMVEDKIIKEFDKLLECDQELEEYFEDGSLVVKKYIKSNLNEYTSKVVDYLTTDKSEDFHKECKKILDKVLKANLNPFVTGFLNIDSMYDGGINKLSDYLKDENNNKEILYYLDGIINKIYKSKVSSAVKLVPRDMITSEIIKVMKNNLNDDNLKDVIKSKILIDEKIITNALTENKENIDNFFYNTLKETINNNISLISNLIVDEVLNVKVSEILKGFNFKVSDINNIDLYIEKSISFIVDKIEINNIVENKLNQIELKEIEDMVISVANKELQYITILGGGLGFVVGIFSLLL